jgi:hypothetical protein
VTSSPTAAWTAQQIVEAFPWSSAPRHLLRDRDGVYRHEFRRRVRALDIEEVLTAPRSPWQNPFVERIIASIRRECVDHLIIFSEAHLHRILSKHLDYYHRSRTHLLLRRTRRKREMSKALISVKSARSRKSVDCTIDTRAKLPERTTNRSLVLSAHTPTSCKSSAPHLFCGGALHRCHRQLKSS